jgi:uncharacterized protein DUF3658
MTAESSGTRPVTSDQLDALILSTAKSVRQKVARIIGKVGIALEDMNQAIEDEQIGERVQVLVDAGRLESWGDVSRPRHSEVRLPVSGLDR